MKFWIFHLGQSSLLFEDMENPYESGQSSLLFEDMENLYENGIISIAQIKIWAPLFLNEASSLRYF